MTKRVKPSAQGTIDDAAERWLRDNDPCYTTSKRNWIAPSTDALSKARSETNEIHTTLENLAETLPARQGHYRRGYSDSTEPAAPSADPLEDLQSDEDEAVE